MKSIIGTFGIFFCMGGILSGTPVSLKDQLVQTLQEMLPPVEATQELEVILDQKALEAVTSPGEVQNVQILPGLRKFKGQWSSNGTITPLSGSIQRTLEIPVLNTGLSKDQIIEPQHIRMEKISANSLNRSTILDPNALIGQSIKMGSVIPLRPVMAYQVQAPILVKKGALVSISFKTDTMELNTQGQALENGGLGEVIRVTNPQTKNVIQGTIDGPNSMVILAPDPKN